MNHRPIDRDTRLWPAILLVAVAGAALTAATILSPPQADAKRSAAVSAPAPTNPAVQRTQIIDELRALNARLGSIEEELAGALEDGVPIRLAEPAPSPRTNR